MLKNRRKTPPGGWRFRQAETRWEMPTPLAWTFDGAVEQIIKHREQNPRFALSTDWETVANELDRDICLRLNHNPTYCTDDSPGGAAKKALALLRRGRVQSGSGSVAGASSGAGGLGRLAAGVNLLVHWLGEGGEAVPQQQAEERARTCVPCPLNGKGDWKAMFTVPVAEEIRQQLEMRKHLKLTTASEDKLGVCSGCDCPLKLKVHVAVKHILDYTADSVWGRLDPNCWMIKERDEEARIKEQGHTEAQYEKVLEATKEVIAQK